MKICSLGLSGIARDRLIGISKENKLFVDQTLKGSLKPFTQSNRDILAYFFSPSLFSTIFCPA